ncbi:MAG: phosphoribosyl-ATP diphosphatase [Ignisphaera sp.]|nr:phosphoribosyl-ATP diphosphatase [Ignisphaera sp.]MCX8167440.1 phosphoribosyl-ATP diphosphatase [Ignisphaera sp.]MDW8084696.1 phosphoribosyl-ATP diphosphatase [Ignisphaera sp.]
MCSILSELYNIIHDRVDRRVRGSYTVQLVEKGKEYIARKVGEEAIEVVIASLAESRERIIDEIADLMYHLMVLMAVSDISLDDVCRELERRRR